MGYPIIDDVVSLFKNATFLTIMFSFIVGRCYVVFPGFRKFIKIFLSN
ncbi:hypothetical protein [uncultured Lactobacillus sp.]|nr:hypothetical protein [uncultured Lactobacillus sp.]